MKMIAESIQHFAKELFGVDTDIELTRPEPQFGDYTTNIAMKLAGKAGKNPRQIAEEIAEKLRQAESIAAVEVAGPGFINIRLTDGAMVDMLELPALKPFSGKKFVVEYSDPNPFKPLHAGHLYTTLVGDMVSRLAEAGGAEVIRANYGGDVGLHVARSMLGIIDHFGGEEQAYEGIQLMEADDLNAKAAFLGTRYAEGTAADEDDPSAHDRVVEYNRRVYQLHTEADHESEFAKIYWVCRDWSYDYFKVLYRELQVAPFVRFIPESEVTPLGVRTVEEQLAKGVYSKSDGAVVFEGEKFGLHTRVFINSHGLPTYETKDVGLSLTKWADYQFDRSIIITAAEQQQYMQVVIKSIEQFAPEPAQRTTHITHGTVKMTGGVKMSSRRGNVLLALDILQSARDAAQAAGRSAQEEIVLAAVKYAFARVRVGSDIAYDPKESVALEGNSGPYLQYAHARACSILVKLPKKDSALPEVKELQPGERLLLRKLTEYNEVVERATNELMPHYICNYLYELAQEFNRFYEKNRVMGDEREALRQWLVGVYRTTLSEGLSLLGIHAPEKM